MIKKALKWFWDKSPWYDFGEFLIDLKYPSCWWGIRHVRHLFVFLGCWFSYAPVLWDDIDIDYGEVNALLIHKLSRLKHHFDTCPYHESAGKQAKEIEYAIEILKRIEADNYFIDELVAHHDKWKKEPTKEIHNGEEVYVYPAMSEEERAEWRPLADKIFAAEEKDWHDLWKYLDEHMRAWWC